MREHGIWGGMIQRCENPKRKQFDKYGGRGIRVCTEWRVSFERFLADVGPAPSSRHSLERIDNDGHYEPGNVRWATNWEQSRNTRYNMFLTLNGKTMTLIDWATRLRMRRETIATRLKRGWSHEQALTTPVGKLGCNFIHGNLRAAAQASRPSLR